jgi:hypothetical protein
LGTLAIAAPQRVREHFFWKKRKKRSTLVKYIDLIEKTCIDQNAQFLLLTIPDYFEIGKRPEAEYPKIFENLNYQMPHSLSTTDYYENPNGHFNNQGHRKYTDFILEILKKLQSPKL